MSFIRYISSLASHEFRLAENGETKLVFYQPYIISSSSRIESSKLAGTLHFNFTVKAVNFESDQMQ